MDTPSFPFDDQNSIMFGDSLPALANQSAAGYDALELPSPAQHHGFEEPARPRQFSSSLPTLNDNINLPSRPPSVDDGVGQGTINPQSNAAVDPLPPSPSLAYHGHPAPLVANRNDIDPSFAAIHGHGGFHHHSGYALPNSHPGVLSASPAGSMHSDASGGHEWDMGGYAPAVSNTQPLGSQPHAMMASPDWPSPPPLNGNGNGNGMAHIVLSPEESRQVMDALECDLEREVPQGLKRRNTKPENSNRQAKKAKNSNVQPALQQQVQPVHEEQAQPALEEQGEQSTRKQKTALSKEEVKKQIAAAKDDAALNRASKRLPCTVANCKGKFASMNNLVRHLKQVHGVDRPYACTLPGCGKRFKRADHLNQHIKIHDPPYACTSCGKAFAQKAQVEKCKCKKKTIASLPRSSQRQRPKPSKRHQPSQRSQPFPMQPLEQLHLDLLPHAQPLSLHGQPQLASAQQPLPPSFPLPSSQQLAQPYQPLPLPLPHKTDSSLMLPLSFPPPPQPPPTDDPSMPSQQMAQPPLAQPQPQFYSSQSLPAPQPLVHTQHIWFQQQQHQQQQQQSQPAPLQLPTSLHLPPFEYHMQ